MKKIIIALMTLVSVVFLATAQEQKPKPKPHPMKVPQAAKDNFAKMYPDVKKVHWEKEHKNFEAEFMKDNMRMEAAFNAQGNYLYTETPVKVADLPKGVSDYVSKNYPGKPIARAEKMTDASNTVTYEAMIKGVPDLVFDAQGNFLKKEK
jgi:hypothetical protein